MDMQDRPTDMLERQFAALRASVRYRNPETGKRSHLHVQWFRWAVIKYLRAFRDELRDRRAQQDSKEYEQC